MPATEETTKEEKTNTFSPLYDLRGDTESLLDEMSSVHSLNSDMSESSFRELLILP
jgi:hypothetical protein